MCVWTWFKPRNSFYYIGVQHWFSNHASCTKVKVKRRYFSTQNSNQDLHRSRSKLQKDIFKHPSCLSTIRFLTQSLEALASTSKTSRTFNHQSKATMTLQIWKANSSQHQRYHEDGGRQTSRLLRRSVQGHHYGDWVHGSNRRMPSHQRVEWHHDILLLPARTLRPSG